MQDLQLAIRSFADVTHDRALDIARALDAHPHLRPLRVGGDPARIKVDPSMETLVANQGLPIDWLTVRRNEPGGAFEGGKINLREGRGVWFAEERPDGEMDFTLIGHELEQTWEADTLEADPASVEQIAMLFEALVSATDAAWGCVLAEAWRPRPFNTTITAALPGIFWMNYYGPAFVSRYPELPDHPRARLLATGGVLIRTTDEPWEPDERSTPAWQADLRDLFGTRAFKWKRPNPALPTVEDHVAASSGTMDMPWAGWQDQELEGQRDKKHSAALKRLVRAAEGRPESVLPDDAVEWSASFDIDEWQQFAKFLTHSLRGDLATAIGKAVIAVINSAPHNDEDSVALSTDHGTIHLGWFIDDIDTFDIAIWGPQSVHDLCEQWFDV